ncbi:sugar kinase [Fulvivirga sp. M361]|uniref:sugar kinase n=1 Tax=Fulvivirga sp. M361 TaxID=2594266 RepID=UPI00117A66E8|nr:sugar kinase [Fulvivirga sp. M361]TRX59521.1 sugar kinase [Fulvivirga sp. M361]
MKIITFGELLMRLTPPGYGRFEQTSSYQVNYGGAEANTSITLAQFGHDVDFVSVLPDTDIGKGALREMKKWGVNTSHIQRHGQKMGLYFMEKGVSIRGGNVIYDRERSSFSDINADTFAWDEILSDADWFHWTGITPGLSAGAAEACKKAIEVAHKHNVTVSCDLNYRRKLWNYGVAPLEVMPELIGGCDIVLANEHDVANYLGIVPGKEDYKRLDRFEERSYAFVSKMLMDKFPQVGKVISTLRQTISATHNLWSGVVYDGSDFTYGPVFDINNIVDRIGGGDSFMGAFIHGASRFEEDKKALEFALAASSLKLTIPGDYNILSEKEVMNFLSQNGKGEMNR